MDILTSNLFLFYKMSTNLIHTLTPTVLGMNEKTALYIAPPHTN